MSHLAEASAAAAVHCWQPLHGRVIGDVHRRSWKKGPVTVFGDFTLAGRATYAYRFDHDEGYGVIADDPEWVIGWLASNR